MNCEHSIFPSISYKFKRTIINRIDNTTEGKLWCIPETLEKALFRKKCLNKCTETHYKRFISFDLRYQSRQPLSAQPSCKHGTLEGELRILALGNAFIEWLLSHFTCITSKHHYIQCRLVFPYHRWRNWASESLVCPRSSAKNAGKVIVDTHLFNSEAYNNCSNVRYRLGGRELHFLVLLQTLRILLKGKHGYSAVPWEGSSMLIGRLCWTLRLPQHPHLPTPTPPPVFFYRLWCVPD